MKPRLNKKAKAKVLWFNILKGYGEAEVLEGRYQNCLLLLQQTCFQKKARAPKPNDKVTVETYRDDERILCIWSAKFRR